MTHLPLTIDPQQLSVFHGDLSPQQALVYLRLAGARELGDCRLRGNIRGPVSHLTRTLSATNTFRDLGPGDDLLARAIIPDPCFWAPGQPYLYDVRIEVVVNGRVVATDTRSFGMRKLGVHQRRLYLESQPWQLIGAGDATVEAAEWEVWREAALVRRMLTPSDQQCAQASREGVMLMADLHDHVAAAPEQLERELVRLSRHAAVAIVVMPAGTKLASHTRTCVPNLLVAQSCVAFDTIAPGDGADLLICQTDDCQSLEDQLQGCRLPVLVQHVGGGTATADEAAARCRQWAARLEPIGCVAGCLV